MTRRHHSSNKKHYDDDESSYSSSDSEAYYSDESSYDGSAIYEDDTSDFKEEEKEGGGIVRNFVRSLLCIVPDDVKQGLKKPESYDGYDDDDKSEEEEDAYSKRRRSNKQKQGKESKKTKSAAASFEEEDAYNDEDEIIDAITNRLPQCRDMSNVQVSTELHAMITQQKWKRATRALEILTDTRKSSRTTSNKMERKYKAKLELYVRQIDENGRTPLSLACGSSSAPADIIRLLLRAYPHAAGMEDKNDNLPIHHFCHSYRRTNNSTMSLLDSRDAEDEVKGSFDEKDDGAQELEVLEMLNKVWIRGVTSLNTYGNLPLHVHVEHQCANNLNKQTLRVALRLLELNSAAAMTKNRGGSLPLHYVGKASLKSHVVPLTSNESKKEIQSLIKGLHDAYPEAVKVKNQLGSTPFFVSVIYNADQEVWNELLLRYPQAATNDNDRGITPISAFWNMFVSAKAKARYLNLTPEQSNEEGKIIKKNRKEMSSIKSRAHFEDSASSRLMDFWAKMELMLRSSALGTPVLSPQIRDNWQPVHAIVKVDECPSDVLKFALQMYKEEAEEVDANGELPLHLASRIPSGGVTRGGGSNKKQDENTKAMITRLVDVYPAATNHFNMDGRFPLHIAIASGKTWDFGIQALVNADKSTIHIPDPVTGLFPFMLAATGGTSGSSRYAIADSGSSEQNASLTTAFELLRASPQLMNTSAEKEKVGRAKELKLREKNLELLRARAKIQKENMSMEANTTKLKKDVASKDKKIEELQKQLKKMQLESSTRRLTSSPQKKESHSSRKTNRSSSKSKTSNEREMSRSSKRSGRSSHIVRKKVE
jgi:ankyrin repeat protein